MQRWNTSPSKKRSVRDMTQIIYYNFKLHNFPSKIILLGSNAFSHCSLPCLHALLEGFFCDVSQHYYMALWMTSIMGPFDDCHKLGEKKKVTRSSE